MLLESLPLMETHKVNMFVELWAILGKKLKLNLVPGSAKAGHMLF